MLRYNSTMEESQEHSDPDRKRKQERNTRWAIVINSCCLIFPMIALALGLTIFVSAKQIKPGSDETSLLSFGVIVPHDRALYVDANPTSLIAFASWMSSLAPMLAGCAVVLVAFPQAQRLLQSNCQDQRQLPSPFQLSLMVQMIDGSTWTGLWSVVLYHIGWKRRCSYKHTALVPFTLTLLATIVLSVVVLAADAWLHLTTTTVGLERDKALNDRQALYGFASVPSCLETNNSFNALTKTNTTCTLDPSAGYGFWADPLAMFQTLNHESSLISVQQIPDSNISYISPAPAALSSTHDYVASTYAVRTLCTPKTSMCNMTLASDDYSTNITYNCSAGFYEDANLLIVSGIEMEAFQQDNFQGLEGPNEAGVLNPFYEAVAFTGIASQDPQNTLTRDPEIFTFGGMGVSAVVLCEATILDLDYTLVRGRVANYTYRVSNESVTNMFASSVLVTHFGKSNMLDDLELATLTVNTAQELADRLGASLGNIILSGGAGSIQPVPAQIARQRDEILVARIPKAPFFLLMSLSLGYAILGAVLTYLAATTSQQGRIAQQRLNIASIVALLFEPDRARQHIDKVEEMFGEYHKHDEVMALSLAETPEGGMVFSSTTTTATSQPQEVDHFMYERTEDDQRTQNRRSRITSWLPRMYHSRALSDDISLSKLGGDVDESALIYENMI